MRRKPNSIALLLSGCATLALAAPSASAQTRKSFAVKVTDGDGGNYKDNFLTKYSVGDVYRRADGYDIGGDQEGAGMEQCVMTQLTAGDGAGSIIGACIGSVGGFVGDIEGDGVPEFDVGIGEKVPDTQQLFVFQVDMDPLLGPTISKAQYMTNLNGNRDRNGMHPTIHRVMGGAAVDITSNYAPNTDVNSNGLTCQANQACRWSRIIGYGLVALSDPGPGGRGDLVQAKPNDNCSDSNGNPAVITETNVGAAWTTNSLHADGCNGNGSDDSWATAVRTVCDPANPVNGYPCDTNQWFDLVLAEDHERERGECFPNESLSSEVGVPVGVCCYTAGNTQPPNKGVRCQAVKMDEGPYNDGNNGEIGRALYDSPDDNGAYVAQNYRDENDKPVYNTEINVAPLDEGLYMARWQCGYPRGGNKRKGLWQSCASVIKFRPTGIDVQALPTTVDATRDVAHGKLASILWGTTDAPITKAVHVTGSIVGSSGAFSTAALIGYDTVNRVLSEEGAFSLGISIDLAHIPNLYGNNPNTQGRNFFQPANISNAGYGVTGGFMPGVKSFFAVPGTTRTLRADNEPGKDYRINENKLGLEIAFLPALVDPAVEDDPIDNSGNDSGDDTNVDDEGTGPAEGGMTSGCRVASSTAPMGGIAFLSVALLLAFRRRRR